MDHSGHFAAVQAKLQTLPYVRMLGFSIVPEEGGVRGLLPFVEHLTGNPLVPALHGGVIAALAHFTAAAELMMLRGSLAMPQVFSCTIEYLASPELRDCEARASITSVSRRFANLRAVAVQPHSGKEIAAATLQFLVK